MPHNFAESLAASHAASDLPIWEEIYRAAFPAFQAMVDHRQDGEHQRAGIDRSVILSTSKQILIDEKARGRNKKTGKVYEDIALEYWSDAERKIPGWVCKPIRADYVAYAIVPLGRCYLLPVPQLQAAWKANETEWKGLTEIVAPNSYNGRKWTTVSVGINPAQLFSAIGKALRIQFTAIPEFVEGSGASRPVAVAPPNGSGESDGWWDEYEHERQRMGQRP